MDVKKEIWGVTVTTSTVYEMVDGEVEEYEIKTEVPIKNIVVTII